MSGFQTAFNILQSLRQGGDSAVGTVRYLKSSGLRLVESALRPGKPLAAVGLCEIDRALCVEYGKSGGVLAPLGGGDLRLELCLLCCERRPRTVSIGNLRGMRFFFGFLSAF